MVKIKLLKRGLKLNHFLVEKKMPNSYTVTNLKSRKKEIEEELQFKKPIVKLEDELYEINDTLKKLGIQNENTTTISN